MTDRINGLIVVLDRDIRDDDAGPIVEAISMIRGVAGVEAHVASAGDMIAEVRERSRLAHLFYDFYKELLAQ